MARYPGGIIRSTPIVPTILSAPGVWTLAEALQAKGQGIWPAVDPYFASVVALLHMEGADTSTTLTDVKGHTFTAAGNAQIDTAQSKYGSGSLLSDGTGDRVTSADHADWELSSVDFTIEFWVRFNSVAAGNSFLVVKINNTATDFMSFGIIRSTASLRFFASADSASFFINDVSFAAGLATGVWYHVAVNRTGTAWRGYIDGVGTALATSSSGIHNSAFPLCIAADNLGNNSLNGWIDELRITKGVGRYPANFTPPTEAFVDYA